MGDPLETQLVRLCNEPRVYLHEYAGLVKDRNAEQLADLVKGRFSERYLLEMEMEPRGGTGFALTALCCLTIEGLESFRQGVNPNEMTGPIAFPAFFGRHPIMPAERVSCKKPRKNVNCSCFYHGVRCGILHMGETTGGWRVRNGNGLPYEEQPDRFILNAKRLQDLVRKDLADYVHDLRNATWTKDRRDPIWDGFLARMSWTVKHCKKTALKGEPGD